MKKSNPATGGAKTVGRSDWHVRLVPMVTGIPVTIASVDTRGTSGRISESDVVATVVVNK